MIQKCEKPTPIGARYFIQTIKEEKQASICLSGPCVEKIVRNWLAEGEVASRSESISDLLFKSLALRECQIAESDKYGQISRSQM